ncbi:cathepsin L.1 [Scomber japonicus]|uniref:cathepsin L.1 n=1 Tax=Scomber japonicus TaxID=13676 RepID=UPI002306BE9F|nr:cathepsin L.1 [Scomber japonicus]
MKLLLVAAAVLTVASCASISLEDLEFHAWKLKFGKSYNSPSEEAYRMKIWLNNRRLVLMHNIMADQGIKSYHLGMTYFADMVFLEDLQLSLQGANSCHQDGPCRYDPAKIGATCTGYIKVKQGDEDALKEAVASVGPVSVGIDASHKTFQLYKSGVHDEPDCSSLWLHHAVLAVGYGTENGHDYWLVNNSWGLHWGEKGYIKMSRNKHNQCGIATDAFYPLV